jgi:hypothetical protein
VSHAPEIIALLNERKKSYQAVFGGARRERTEVWKDLERFCRGTTSTFHADPRVHAALEGRREVYLRIQQHLDLSPEELADLYGAVAPTKDTDNG